MHKMNNEPHAKRRGWLKNGNPPGNPQTAPRLGVGRRRGEQRRANPLRWPTGAVGCMEVRARGRKPPRALHVLAELIGSTGNTLKRQSRTEDNSGGQSEFFVSLASFQEGGTATPDSFIHEAQLPLASSFRPRQHYIRKGDSLYFPGLSSLALDTSGRFLSYLRKFEAVRL